jgi:hypothetical protein
LHYAIIFDITPLITLPARFSRRFVTPSFLAAAISPIFAFRAITAGFRFHFLRYADAISPPPPPCFQPLFSLSSILAFRH